MVLNPFSLAKCSVTMETASAAQYTYSPPPLCSLWVSIPARAFGRVVASPSHCSGPLTLAGPSVSSGDTEVFRPYPQGLSAGRCRCGLGKFILEVL